jgi:putative phosphonate catabolism associated alcohol dehydrogenase
MTTGRVAVFSKPNTPMEIREYKVPNPEPGAVIIKVSLCNICGSDLHAWNGGFDLSSAGGKLPTVLGHEMVGKVHSLGEGVNKDSSGKTLQVGDRVVFQYFYNCGKCANCLKGKTVSCYNRTMAMTENCDQSPHFVGGYGDYFYLKPNHVIFKIPENLEDEIVSGINCATAQLIYGLKRVNLSFGETIVIQGAGGLGIYATAVAKEMGAHQVIVIDGVKERLELVKEFGADEVINMEEYKDSRSRVKAVKELTNSLGADVVVELVGIPQAIDEGLKMLSLSGRYLVVGNITKGAKVEIEPSKLVFGNRSIIGVSTYEPQELKESLDFISRTKDKYPYQKLFGSKFKLEDINYAFELAAERRVTRASIIMTSDE